MAAPFAKLLFLKALFQSNMKIRDNYIDDSEGEDDWEDWVDEELSRLAENDEINDENFDKLFKKCKKWKSESRKLIKN